MTILPRSATATELGYIRRDNQSTRLYLTAHQPATVYTARLAAVPTSTDQVTAVTYNSGSGTHTNILADQTLLVGSSAGAFDYGQCRIRNTTGIGATSGTFNVAEESEVNWTSGAYLTVLDEFIPWARHLRTVGTSVYMDYDVAYSDQHSKCDSVPVLGPSRVAWLNDATVTLAFDASQSWSLNNTVTGYAWTFTGATATTGTTTATPTATYNATGTYRVACTITNSDSKTFTGYRYVFVVNESTVIDQFSLGSVRGDYSSGGWSFDVTLYAQAARTTIRDRALIILHAVDYYGDTQSSVGYVAGSENVVAIGYVAGDSINWQPENLGGSVSFSVQGLQYWLNKMAAFPVGLKDNNSTPTKWTRFYGLTGKAVTWHMLHWRTTLTRLTDVFAFDESHRAARIEAPGAQTLWQQLSTMQEQALLAKPCCDRYGRLFSQVEQQLLNTTERASIPSVMTITSADWTGQIDIERSPTPECSLADFSGVAFDGTTATPFYSLSPGHVFKQYGTPDIRERLIFDTQVIANQRCGAYVGWKNNNYPRISINLASNNRLLDVAPWQWATLSIASTDTVREITVSSLRLIPRAIEYVYQDGYMTSRIEFEGESTAEIAVTNIRPPIVITPIEIINPPPPPPPPVPTPTATGKEVWLWHYNATTTPVNAVIYSTDFFTSLGSPTWHAVAALPADLAIMTGGSIRADGATCYIVGRNTGSPQRIEIWKSDNPKAVSPTWTKVLAYGGATVPGGGAVTLTNGNVVDFDESSNGWAAITQTIPSPITPLNGSLLAAHTNEGGLVLHRGFAGSAGTPIGLWRDYGIVNAPRKLYKLNAGYSAFGAQLYPGGDYTATIPDSSTTAVQFTGLGAPYYNGCYGKVGNKLAGRGGVGVPSMNSPSTSWRTLYDFTTTGTLLQTVSGSFFGNSVYALAQTDGYVHCQLYYSTNGIDFAQSSDQVWVVGKVLSANLSGGKFVIWVICNPYYARGGATVVNSNEFIRYCSDISDVTGNPWTSATGDMWTSVISSGDLALVNAGIVYA